jgi:phasin family protein
MNSVPEQLTTIGKAQIDNAVRFAEIASQGARRIAELNINATQAAIAETLNGLKSLSDCRDIGEIPAAVSKAARPRIENMSGYARGLYEAATSTGAEVANVMESQVSEYNRQLSAVMDAASRSAPSGSEAAVAAVRSMMAVSNSIFDTMSKAARQMVAISEANMRQMQEHGERAASSAQSAAQSAAQQVSESRKRAAAA